MSPFTRLPPPHAYTTPQGALLVTPIGHASLLLQLDGQTIYNDPYSEVADFTDFPKADLVLLTHEHYDHLDRPALDRIRTPATTVVGPVAVAQELDGVTILQNGESVGWRRITITATPAYNIRQRRPDGELFHPKGRGNGYILDVDGFRLYIAGDTELIPEMAAIAPPDIAFIPKNLPYTMSDEMFIEAARQLKPRMLYPYHYFEVDRPALQRALTGITVK
ncbi:MAG: MBL fold metallo-hydrolase [Prevotellaceae bacterium]|jgi:L-ascorbate metabolism protein UlaG (beta-lactamase superfamily)|nr:MBL fold metallo-hydrolase [Prevotellaceae bacterium]